MKNQTVLITGASSGIGKELAILFAKNKMDVVLVARSQTALETLATQLIQDYSINATVIVNDLSQPNAAQTLFTDLQNKNIGIDILINNAGFGIYGKFYETDITEILGMISVNMTALTELTYLLLPHMLKNKFGKIMNVSSLGAFQACPTMAVYCATKAYILSFSEALAEELNQTGITVTALCPGVTATGFQARSRTDKVRLVKNNFYTMSAQSVAEMGFKTLMKGKPIVITGLLNKILAFLIRLTPRRMNTRLAGFLMG